MGHRSKHAPHRGSLAYRPRKRAKSIVPWVRTWVLSSSGGLAGLPAYKVGMGHLVYTESYKASPNFGRDVSLPYTLLEVPPITVMAVRVYNNGKCLGESWATLDESTVKKLKRKTKPGKGLTIDEIKKLTFDVVRVLIATNPDQTGMRKKTPEILEIPVDAEPSKALDLAIAWLGKTLKLDSEAFPAFKLGAAVDAVAISKGKGMAGPIARFGMKLLPHKSRKTKRGPGATGPQRPGVVPATVGRPGQMGFHHRVDHNKKIVLITDSSKFKFNGGIKHYGVPHSTLIGVSGSVPGPAKRLVLLRLSVKGKPIEPPAIAYNSIS
ncbi:MAG: 50S ribosomal protein L3 [Thermoprotei archaeon]